VSLSLQCYVCLEELDEPAAIIVGIPEPSATPGRNPVDKTHLCLEHSRQLNLWLDAFRAIQNEKPSCQPCR
jgi:hypothetical protein